MITRSNSGEESTRKKGALRAGARVTKCETPSSESHGGIESSSSFNLFSSPPTPSLASHQKPESPRSTSSFLRLSFLRQAQIKEDDVTSEARGGETTHSKKKQTDASSFAASEPPANNSLVRNQKTTHRQLRHCEPQRKREQEERDIDGVGPHLEGENFRALVGGIGEKRKKQKKECVKS